MSQYYLCHWKLCSLCECCSDYWAYTSSQRSLSNDFVRLLTEISVASFSFISFFLLQRSLSSHGSSHLYTATSKFSNRMEALSLTFLYVVRFYSAFCCLLLGFYQLQSTQNLLYGITKYNFSFTFSFLNCKKKQTSLEICFLFWTLCMVLYFLCNMIQKACFIFLGIKNPWWRSLWTHGNPRGNEETWWRVWREDKIYVWGNQICWDAAEWMQVRA